MLRVFNILFCILLSLTSCAVGVKKASPNYSLDQIMEVMTKAYYERMSLDDKRHKSVIRIKHCDSVYKYVIVRNENNSVDELVRTDLCLGVGQLIFFSVPEEMLKSEMISHFPNSSITKANTFFFWTDKSKGAPSIENIIPTLYRLNLRDAYKEHCNEIQFDDISYRSDRMEQLAQIFYRKDNPYINKVIMSPFVVYEPPVL